MRCKSALNRVHGMPFRWSLNPYAGCRHSCVYCFARQFYVKADHGDRSDFAARILVKENFPDVLRQELSKPTWRGESPVLGTATDPYQPAEGRFRHRSVAAASEPVQHVDQVTAGAARS
jgi:DNA repair photolyase